MAKKVSKNQRTDRGNTNAKKMAKIIVATKKSNGEYSFQQRMVDADQVKEELKAAKA